MQRLRCTESRRIRDFSGFDLALTSRALMHSRAATMAETAPYLLRYQLYVWEQRPSQ